MSNKNFGIANLDQSKRQTSHQLQAQTVSAVVISLGSNHQADQHLASIRKNLAKLGKITLSTAFQNPDIHATSEQPKPDYSNQCVHLSLHSAMTLQQLQRIFRQFENDCGRQRTAKKTAINQIAINQITMDIDILLVCLKDTSEWVVMAERYPFKDHERAGLMELDNFKLSRV